MKRKTGIIIISVCLFVMIAEMLAFFVFIKPAIRVRDFYYASDAGDCDEMITIFKKLPNSKKEEAISVLKDVSVHYTNEYIEGKIAYEDLNKILQCGLEIDGIARKNDVRGVTGFSSTLIDCYIYANQKELERIFQLCVDEYKENGKSDIYYRYVNDFKNVYNLSFTKSGNDFDDTKTITNEHYINAIVGNMESIVSKTVRDYASGIAPKEIIDTYVDVLNDCFVGNEKNSFERLNNLKQNLDAYVTDYRKFVEMMGEEKFAEVYSQINDYLAENKGKEGFEEREKSYVKLSQKALEAAKGYYPSEINAMLGRGEIDQAAEMIRNVESVFGNEVNLSKHKEYINSEWKRAYCNYMSNYEINLQNSIEEGVVVGEYCNSKDVDLAANKPNLMCLVRMDEGGIPELILYNSRSGYTYILTYVDGEVKLAGCLKVENYCENSEYIIGTPYSKNVMSMDIKYELYKFDRSKPSFEVVNTIIAKGDNSYFNIDGEEYFPKTEDGEYTGESIPNLKKRTNEKVNEILKNAVGGGFEPGEKESVSIGRAFNYIFEY
ncbi:hypothetical protein [Eubacterium ruminantium]|uniref:hypothetical protein n=1 Tax=Eubacterium ruminantium TaxID=42322 RepID=UPI00247B1CCE|nr:hypothetical protein [Eubacterium ruminantium]